MRQHRSYGITGVPQASELQELRAMEGIAHSGQVSWRRRRGERVFQMILLCWPSLQSVTVQLIASH